MKAADIPLTEDMLQVYSADVIRAFKVPGVIAYHVPNGGKRHIAVAKKMQKFGTLPGVADWAFVLPNGRAAFIELKIPGGTLGREQIKFIRACQAIDVPYYVAKSPEAFDGFCRLLGVINKPINSVAQLTGGEGRRAAGAVPVSRYRSRKSNSGEPNR